MNILKKIFLNKKSLIITGFFFVTNIIKAQNDYINVDSLIQLYNTKKNSYTQQLILLEDISNNATDPQIKLTYSDLLILKAKEKDSTNSLYSGLMQKGSALRLKSDLTESLRNFLKAAEIAPNTSTKIKNTALTNIAIGDVYSIIGDHENSKNYYENGIKKLRELKSDSIQLATALLNLGDEYYNAEKYDKAMSNFYESSLISNKIGFKVGSAYNLGNIGLVYAKQGKYRLAKANLDEAIYILESIKEYYPIAVYLESIADIYLEQEKLKLAEEFAKRSLRLSNNYQLKEQISSSSLKLSKIYELLNNSNLSLFHLKNHLVYKDSVTNIKAVQEMANLTTKFEVEKKQVQLDLMAQEAKTQKIKITSATIGLILMSLLVFGIYRRNLRIKRTAEIIDAERKKSDAFLLNLLPKEAADELKEHGSVEAKRFENVTVLFTDFKGFTSTAEKLAPEKLVKAVDFYFSKFDDIVKKYQLEKIKTIGDAYMCAGGIPTPLENHAEKMAYAALEILDFVKEEKKNESKENIRFDIRIGIHTGPVVAGVVGKNKFAYDIWGDTVNIASRMESASDAGKINISENTYNLIKHKFIAKERGTINIKNRSALEMFYLVGAKNS